MNDRFTFSPDVGKLIRSSHDEARRLGHRWLEVEHLLLGILAEPECTAAEILHALRCDYSELKTAVEHAIQPCERDLPEIDGSPVKDMPLTKETEGVLRRSYEEADEAGDKRDWDEAHPSQSAARSRGKCCARDGASM